MATKLSRVLEEALVVTPSIKRLNPVLRAAIVAARVWTFEESLVPKGKELAVKFAVEDMPEAEKATIISKITNFTDETAHDTTTETSLREKVRVLTNPRV